jgi:hypothetical protein
VFHSGTPTDNASEAMTAFRIGNIEQAAPSDPHYKNYFEKAA